MTTSDKGVICDICGEFIDENPIQPVEIKGIPHVFHVHKSTPGKLCRDQLQRAAREKNFQLLPDCYLKEIYFGMIKIQEKINAATEDVGEEEAVKEALRTILAAKT